MTVSSVILVGQEPVALDAAREAAALAFPNAPINVVDDLDALIGVDELPHLVILARPKPEDLAVLENTTNEFGRCRWPVVILGESPKRTEFLTLDGKLPDAKTLAVLFGSVSKNHRLEQENLRLRNDLMTVATRASHDLRRPLGGIFIIAELLQSVLSEKLPEETPNADALLASAQEMGQTIERIFFMVRTAAQPPVMNPVGMDEPVTGALAELEKRITKRGASIIQPPQWPRVRAAAAALEVIWWNLIANALDHAGPAPRIELGWRWEPAQYRFWVRDNGAGPPTERLDHLFQPFHLLHEDQARHGLGLSIVHRLVSLQGGVCGFEPVPDGGSCFFFTIPIEAEDPPKPRKKPATVSQEATF